MFARQPDRVPLQLGENETTTEHVEYANLSLPDVRGNADRPIVMRTILAGRIPGLDDLARWPRNECRRLCLTPVRAHQVPSHRHRRLFSFALASCEAHRPHLLFYP